MIDVRPGKRAARSLTLRITHLHAFLGIAIPPARCEEILRDLGFSPSARDGTLRVAVPSWRVDVESEVDLIEEVIRCEGYDRLPETLPAPYVPAKERRAFAFEDRVRDLLVSQGLLEASTYSFVSGEENRPFEAAAPGTPVVLENPLAEPYSTMRATPVIGLLQSARHNVRRGIRDLGLFEVGARLRADRRLGERSRSGFARIVTSRSSSRDPGGATGRRRLARSTSSTGRAPSRRSSAASPSRTRRSKPVSLPFLAPGRAAAVVAADGGRLGWVGVLAASLGAAWDLPDAVVSDLDLGLLSPRVPPPPDSVEAPPKLPGSEVDLTVTHAVTVPWRELEERRSRRGAGGASGRGSEGALPGSRCPGRIREDDDDAAVRIAFAVSRARGDQRLAGCRRRTAPRDEGDEGGRNSGTGRLNGGRDRDERFERESPRSPRISIRSRASFRQLERRVEALASRLKAALEENGRLKAAASAAAAERTGARGRRSPRRRRPRRRPDDAATRLKAYETERAEVRARIERLIASLEGA